MLRHLFPFLLPFAVYAAWVLLTRRTAAAGGSWWQATPVAWLSLAGLVLIVMSFVALALFTGHEPGGTYVPPRYIGGEIVPAETR